MQIALINKRLLLCVQGAGLRAPKNSTINDKRSYNFGGKGRYFTFQYVKTRGWETLLIIHTPGTLLGPIPSSFLAHESDCYSRPLLLGVTSYPSGMWRTTFTDVIKKQFRNLISREIFQRFSTCGRSRFEDYELPLSDPL